MRIYHYVGDVELKQQLPKQSHRYCVINREQLIDRLKILLQPASDNAVAKSKQQSSKAIRKGSINQVITMTYIVDLSEQLWINDRHSEHIVCADGQPVLAAGEITFQLNGDEISVNEISNQSTGYCPEPECWQVLDQILTRLVIDHPTDFTSKFIFRLCSQCGNRNIVKDEWYYCAICDAQLPSEWNFERKS